MRERSSQGLCLPTDEVVLVEAIRKFVAEALDQPVQSIGIDDDFYDVLGLDSIGTVACLLIWLTNSAYPNPLTRPISKSFVLFGRWRNMRAGRNRGTSLEP